MQLGLTEDEKAMRVLGIGGSDASKIMNGEWHELWEIKTGRKEDADLSDVFHVQLGHATEKFNLYWLKQNHQVGLMTDDLSVVRSKEHDFMQCMPDALGVWNDGSHCGIDAKHTNQWSTTDVLYKRYYWQLTHNAVVTESTTCVISPIYGNQFGPPIVWELNAIDSYRLIEAERTFWWHVENNIEPVNGVHDILQGLSKIEIPPIDDMLEVDMEGNNEWASLAEDFKDNKEQHDKHAKAKKGIRSLIDDNVKLATGHGVTAKRGNDNRVRISIDKKRQT